jgi:aminopeptidase N
MTARATPALEAGISHDLAKWRSRRCSDVRYHMSIAIAAPVRQLEGTVEIGFALAQPSDIVLDWRPPSGGGISALTINGRAVARPRIASEHLVIPARAVRAGANAIALRFRAPIAIASTAVALYRDRGDGAEYVYSLFVPADASTVFPCFDQPDLKARFCLSLDIPPDWQAVANAPSVSTQEHGGSKRIRFAPTHPLSTYVFAFAAGPFEALAESDFTSNPLQHPAIRLFVRQSRFEDARAEAAEVFRLSNRVIAFLKSYFDFAFPFPKYDLVLLPEFPYGGMEHAGAAFLREDSILFPAQPTATDLAQRAQLLFHETAHQWFGDLVTMRWFDDLWLKEGFATLMAAKAVEQLLPEQPAWRSFHHLKVAAYRTDETHGTTPIWQRLPNLSAAKSVYGAIVYGKAPAVLRQAEFYLGAATFRRAVQLFLREHAYRAVDWRELVRAFERASGRKLDLWAQAWIKRRGLPRVEVEWQTDTKGRVRRFVLAQSNGVWPMRTEIILGGDRTCLTSVELANRTVRLRSLEGQLAPRWVFANHGDYAYGRFLLDDASRTALLDELDFIAEPMLRTLLREALWEDVRDARLAPTTYLDLALRQVRAEADELAVASLLRHVEILVRWYLLPVQRTAIAPRVESSLRDGFLGRASAGLRVTYFRAFAATATTAEAGGVLKDLLAASVAIPGVVLRSRDRFRIVERLLALEDAEAEHLLAAEAANDPSDAGRRYAYAAAAARPNTASKARIFAAFLEKRALADSWIEDALEPFNTVEHAALTTPYLPRALGALPRLKRERKIFFVNRWLAAFVGGQTDRASLALVRRHLSELRDEPDLRRKLLEYMDGLERTVRIRTAFGGEPSTSRRSRRAADTKRPHSRRSA